MMDLPQTIKSPDGSVTARIRSDFGFNLFELLVPAENGPLDLLWSEPSFAAGEGRASGSGIPLLFPFPGRIAGTTLEWQGRSYPLTAGDGRGNAIHGFVLDRPWRILEQSDHGIVGQFQASVDDAAILEHWPADFRITARYELKDGRLDGEFLLENPDSKALPCGFGTHPYFRLPLGGPNADPCLVRLPVRSEWELRDMIPTGRNAELSNVEAVQSGRPFGELQLDNVYGGLVFDEQGIGRAAIEDPATRRQVAIEFNDVFRECVVYTPPHREAICIEPYTCVPGAFHLISQGVDTGIRELPPGESFRSTMTIRWG